MSTSCEKHHHEHQHTNNRRTLMVSLAFIGGFMLIEFIGGLWANSLALLSDAGHMLSDAVSLLLALLAVLWGSKGSTRQHTFGFKRLEILAALFNGLALLAIAVYICYEAVIRLAEPQHVASTEMLIIASIGLVVNIFVAWYMHRGGDVQHNLNMKAAYLHVLGDLLGSIAAIVAGILIMAFGWLWADAITSLIVVILIMRGGWSTTRQAWHVLMEASPDINIDTLLALLQSDNRVESVHDLHIWSIDSGFHALSCHLVVNENMTVAQITALQKEIEQKLRDLQINHSSIQIESSQHGHDNNILCHLPKPSTQLHHH